MYSTYEEDVVAQLIKESYSFSEVLLKMGKSPVGGNITHLTLRCKQWGVDTSHFKRKNARRGKRALNRKSAEERLVMGSPLDYRVSADKLRRALFDLGVEYKCNCCGINEWLGKPIVLEIDHIDEQYWNNQPDNLQFLCPNCHTMKTK